ncbi:MAG: GTPase [Actinomycetota bacterium]|nr:GTPase [Actinomycetota bacterium]
MSAPAPRIAVIGRQNVGKSTLVNRLFGRREAIAHPMAGVTRDRIELDAVWNGRRFTLIDTGGYAHDARGIESKVADQASRAAAEADLIVLVVDARSGITQDDDDLARRLRRVDVPVLVVANKVDAEKEEPEVTAFIRLGLGEPFAVSALHGLGAGDLLDRIVALLPDAPRSTEAVEPEPRFALVGRPNVGKSSLFNGLIGQDRSVVFEEAGTTRDAVDALVEWPGLGTVRFVDTAGMRRGTKVRGVEYYSVLRATEAIERAHAAVLVLDATEGFTGEDKKIANLAINAGRALLVVANKWDLVEDKDRTFKIMQEEVSLFAKAEAIRTSAKTSQGVHRLPPILMELHHRWRLRIPTSRVNDVMHEAQAERPTPRAAGSLHYATQIGSAPPSFVVFGGAKEPGPGYRRYMENRFRREFGFEGVPIRFSYRPRTRGSDKGR